MPPADVIPPLSTNSVESNGVVTHYESASPPQIPNPATSESEPKTPKLQHSSSPKELEETRLSVISSTLSSAPSLVSSIDASSIAATLYSKTDRHPGVTRSDTTEIRATNLLRSDSTATTITIGSPPSLASSTSPFSAFDDIKHDYVNIANITTMGQRNEIRGNLTTDTFGKRNQEEMRSTSKPPDSLAQTDELNDEIRANLKQSMSVGSVRETFGQSTRSESDNGTRPRKLSESRNQHPEDALMRSMEAVMAMTSYDDGEEDETLKSDEKVKSIGDGERGQRSTSKNAFRGLCETEGARAHSDPEEDENRKF
ncbi:hypothetical protein HK096_005790, partial [Nowakowskiella sp. JEL0078]